MVSAKFVPNVGAISSMLHSPSGLVGVWLVKVGQAVVEAAQRLAPVGETGNLRRSIGLTITAAPLSADVEATADYALAVHQGTRPHVITPNSATVLRFPSKRSGGMVFAQRVNHPGTAAVPFLTDALRLVI